MPENFAYDIIEIGNKVLSETAAAVDDFEDPALISHVDAMFRLMEEKGGVGIAAPQIGIGIQILIIASRPNRRYPHAPHMKPILLCNPHVLSVSEALHTDWEGCLSVPGIRGRVTRPDAVVIKYQNLAGKPIELALQGFPARVFLHEYDHLIGKTFLDRVASTADLYSEKEYFKLIGGN